MRPGPLNRSFAIPCRQTCFGALLSSLFLVAAPVSADIFPLPPEDVDLIGRTQVTTASKQDTLLDIAYLFNLGQIEILEANPKVDRWLPGEGTLVELPTRFILPDAPRRGIVLNLPEMRLYYYPDGSSPYPETVITHPVSIGRMDWKTPLGTTRVSAKQKDPAWIPPASVKQEAAADGEQIPDVVPPGPDNPLGRYALRLGIPGYLIHSTNKPFGVGMRVTHGCVRMYPADIEALFQQVQVNTPVQIVDQPVKVGWFAGSLYLEVHAPLEVPDDSGAGLMKTALELIYQELEDHPAILDGSAVRRAVRERNGIPTAISKPPL